MALGHAARARALLRGRHYCIADDIHDLAVPVLAHRVRLATHADGFVPTRDEAEIGVARDRRARPRSALTSACRNGSNASLRTRLRASHRRMAAARCRPPRRLKFTREGKFFVGITLGVGFAAINTGNNLLYLLLGMLLALIVVSGVMSELSLRDLTVVRRLPLRAQVGRAHLVEIEVFNHKCTRALVRDRGRGPPRRPARRQALLLSQDQSRVGAGRRVPAHARRAAGATSTSASASRRAFPSGSSRSRARCPREGELVIYPAVDPVQPRPAHGRAHAGGDGVIGRGHGEDFLGLKLMREGEDPRDIHWRKSAAVGPARHARARPRDAARRRRSRSTRCRPENAGDEWTAAFERRIRDVASRAVAHLKRGDRVTS